MNWIDIFTAAASAGTTLGVFLAWWQIKASKQLNRTAFEDGLAREYREIVKEIPIRALLGESLTPEDQGNSLRYFYRYIDLTNDQIFLRQEGRVSAATWENWRDGIKTMMAMPAFSAAWQEIKEKPTTKFDELRKLEKGEYDEDCNPPLNPGH